MTEYFEPKSEHIEREGWGYKNLEKLDLEEHEIIETFDENHIRYKSMIKEILEYYSLATNNDFILMVEFWRLLGFCTVTSGKDNFVFKIPRNMIKYIPNPECSSRVRRALNSKGVGLATNKSVLLKRSKNQKAITKYFAMQ
jgi:hypothetical protein